MSKVALPVFVSMAVQRVNLSVTYQKRRLGSKLHTYKQVL